MSNLLPNQQRAQWAAWTIAGYAVVLLIFALVQFWQANLIISPDFTDESAALSDGIVGSTAVIFLIGLVFTAVTFILWFRRAYANLHRLNSETVILSQSEGWAAGAWFVPFVNLFRPYTIAKEIWLETQAQIPGKVARDGLVSTALVGYWWAAWISYNILSQITSKMGDETTLEGIRKSLIANAIGSLIGIPAAILCYLFIKKVSAWEEELYHSSSYSIDPVDHLLE